MKVHSSKSSILAKRLWNFLRFTFVMMRKGLISKKKLIMDINLFFKRGRLIRKSFSNFLHLHHHHHHHHRHQMTRGTFGPREYEFSCSNSPNPVFFHMSSKKHKHHHHDHHHNHIHLPCMDPPNVFDDLQSQDGDLEHVDENNAIVVVPKTPEYSFNLRLDGYDLAPGENCSSPIVSSPFPIMISDYLSEDENEGNVQVDYEAEEFIKKFYDQLRAQSRIQLLQY